MTTTVIEFAAKVHGYRRGERVEVDADDPRVVGLIEGSYAFEVDEAQAATDPAQAPADDPASSPPADDPAGAPATQDPDGPASPGEPLTVTADPVRPAAAPSRGRRGTTA